MQILKKLVQTKIRLNPYSNSTDEGNTSFLKENNKSEQLQQYRENKSKPNVSRSSKKLNDFLTLEIMKNIKIITMETMNTVKLVIINREESKISRAIVIPE